MVKNPSSSRLRRVEKSAEIGSISALAIGFVAILAWAGFGTWGYLRTWRKRVETQLRLDQCVAREALSLKNTVQLVESSNQRMKDERAIAEAAAAAPFVSAEALATARAILIAEEVFQDGIRIKWGVDKALWMTGAPCGNISGDGSRSLSLPDWQREPDDSIGPEPYQWSDADPHFRIEIHSGSRSEAALIDCQTGLKPSKESPNDSSNLPNTQALGKNTWHAHWTPASGLPGASSY